MAARAAVDRDQVSRVDAGLGGPWIPEAAHHPHLPVRSAERAAADGEDRVHGERHVGARQRAPGRAARPFPSAEQLGVLTPTGLPAADASRRAGDDGGPQPHAVIRAHRLQEGDSAIHQRPRIPLQPPAGAQVPAGLGEGEHVQLRDERMPDPRRQAPRHPLTPRVEADHEQTRMHRRAGHPVPAPVVTARRARPEERSGRARAPMCAPNCPTRGPLKAPRAASSTAIRSVPRDARETVLVAVMQDRAGGRGVDTSHPRTFSARHNHPMREPGHADVIVVGLGAMGSAIIHRLTRRGLRVIGVDRHHPPHDRGSTHGDTRITRLAIGEGPEYAPLVRRSHALWRELEAETGTTLMRQVGGLVIGDADDPFLAETRANAELHEIAHENLGHRALTERFPMFAAPPGTEAYLEPEAGLLHPEAAVRAQLSLSAAAGSELRLGTDVRSWEADGDGVTVVTGEGELHARELVLCAGAWIPRLVPEYGDLFAVHPQWLHWFPIREGYAALRSMPIFIWEMPGVRDAFTHLSAGFYGFPAIDGPAGGVKLATERYEQPADPDVPMPARTGAREAARLHDEYLAQFFPWVDRTPLRTASCLYTNTRGSRFLIGPHPERPRVTVVAACSGHGFKHSPAIGEAVAARLVDGTSAIDLSPFALPPPCAAGSRAPAGSG